MAQDVRCDLCPKRCAIAPGQSGECRVRVNDGGRLLAITYGHPCSVNLDPVEKKPLFHFLPGTRTLSLATAGCNLHCRNCQNWEISQANPAEIPACTLPPDEIPALAKREADCPSVSFTYTDPVAFFEYALDGSAAARKAGLKAIQVTAGYINREPWRKLCRETDAAHIDLKSMEDRFYRENCGGTLKPVLDAIATAKQEGVWIEIIHLVIPTLNDEDGQIRELARWLARNAGPDTPLHFSAFHPAYRLTNLPPTPAETLLRAKAIAKAEGMEYVYLGNVTIPGGEDTLCPGCGKLLVERKGYTIARNDLKNGSCPGCGRKIPGVWENKTVTRDK
jgi:pyruvate formate lyase activating enzyme